MSRNLRNRLLGWGCLVAASATPALATQNVSLSFVPLGSTTLNGNTTLTVEIFVATSASSQVFRGTQIDLPCNLPGGVAPSVTVTTLTTDPDGDGLRGPSSGGIPFLFGPGGLGPVAPAPCRIAGTPTVGQPPVTLPAGTTRYLGTVVYDVGDCAGGDFSLIFESFSTPPIGTDATRLIAPDGPDPDALDDLIPFKPDMETISVPIAQCCDGQSCLGDLNTYCCVTVNSAVTHPGDSCSTDACPCANSAECDDGLFCNGAETCVGNVCQPGTAPCSQPTPNCVEAEDRCVFCLVDADCADDGIFCNGTQTCNTMTGLCEAGANLPVGTPCGDATDNDCTNPDTCNGFGSCVANNAPAGSPCEDGLFCTVGSTCQGGICLGGVPRDCNDNLACTADSCNEGLDACDNILVVGFCLIDDPPPGSPVCYADGTLNPNNPCEACEVTKDTDDWSARADGTACPDEGNDCTGDECFEGVCIHPNLPAGTLCDDGDPCTGTGQPGIGVDECDGAGACTGTLDPLCNDDCATAVVATEGKTPGDNTNSGPDDGEAGCQPNSNNDIWYEYTATCTGRVHIKTAGSILLPSNDTVLSVYDACGGNEIACDDDGGVGLLSALTIDTVEGTTYFIRVAGYANNIGFISLTITTIDDCVIDDICYGEGDPNPLNPCEVCNPALSSSDWSPALKGTACGDPTDTECDSPDSCDGNGSCEVNFKPDSSPCANDGFECTLDFCLTGVCTHPSQPAGTSCGSSADTECDNPDTCDGGTTCLTNFEAVFTPCGDPMDSDCDNPDTCDGAGSCSINNEPDGVTCTDDGNDCKADICAAGVCTHPDEVAGFPCGSPADTNCDNPDTCNGFGVCNNNHESDGFPCGDGDTCTTGDACADGVCVGTPAPQDPIAVATSQRSFDVTALPPASAVPIALRVTSPKYPCLLMWVQADGTLGNAPVFQTPSTWGTIHVTGQDVVPSSTYMIQAECGSFLSTGVMVDTWLFGDIDNNGIVDSDDILLILMGFQGDFSLASLVQMDIMLCTINGIVDVDDIVAVLDAFMGRAYGDKCPVPCQ